MEHSPQWAQTYLQICGVGQILTRQRAFTGHILKKRKTQLDPQQQQSLTSCSPWQCCSAAALPQPLRPETENLPFGKDELMCRCRNNQQTFTTVSLCCPDALRVFLRRPVNHLPPLSWQSQKIKVQTSADWINIYKRWFKLSDLLVLILD